MRQLLFKDGWFLVDGKFQRCDLRTRGSTIAEIDSDLTTQARDVVVPLDGLFGIPGLINSHDHLEFNLFPRLGRPPYQNYVDWSNDIQEHCKSEINRVLRIPLKYRLLWGAYKNVFSGVTTVIHHNPYNWRFRFGFPIDVFKGYQWIHSLKLEKRNLKKLLSDDQLRTFIHLAEGIDGLARNEFKELCKLGGLTKRTVIIHGIGIGAEDIPAMERAEASLVWCPSSNMYLFGETAIVESMLGRIPVSLGTDSTLTGSANLLDEMRFAQSLKRLSSKTVVDLVTKCPKKMLRLENGEICRGGRADFLFFATNDLDPFDAILTLTPGLLRSVWRKAELVFGDIEFSRYDTSKLFNSTTLELNGIKKFIVGDFAHVKKVVSKYIPSVTFPI